MYILAILCPPLAILLCGKPFQAILSVALCLCLWFPGCILAFLVVASTQADARTRRLIRNDNRNTRRLVKAMRAAEEPQPQVIVIHERPRPRPIHGPTLPGPRNAALPQSDTTQGIPDRSHEPVIVVVTWRERIAAARAVAAEARDFLVGAYRVLPEWGQPVVWGMVAATPAVLLIVLLSLR